MGSIERIKEMESILDECTGTVMQLEEALDRLDGLRERMGMLYEYYGSADWYDDREMELPEGMKAGVLSEDLVYNNIMDTRDASFRMLKLATDILKDKI